MNQVICFIPCCSSKVASGRIINDVPSSVNKYLGTWHSLDSGRQRIKELATEGTEDIIFDCNSPATSALYLYTGAFYRQLQLRTLISTIQTGRLRLFVLSAGNGIVDAFEPLQNYDAELKGKVAKVWREADLAGVISEMLLTLKPSRVFGFFAGNESWSDPGAKYRYFFVEGMKRAQKEGLDVGLSGCFYRSAGRGTAAILGSLGRTFMDLVKSDFNESLVSGIAANPRTDGTTVISFERS